MITYEEANGQLIITELLGLDMGAPPAWRAAAIDARRLAREAAAELQARLSTARAYSAYGRGLASILEREERIARSLRW